MFVSARQPFRPLQDSFKSSSRSSAATGPLLPYICHRCSHHFHHRERAVPPPTPFVPNKETFLTLIGRGLKSHASKIPSWESMFTMTSAELRQAGIGSARERKYLLWWRERFRQGIHGIGGDLTEVVQEEGQGGDSKKSLWGEIRVVEVPISNPDGSPPSKSSMMVTATRRPGMRKVALNVRPGHNAPSVELSEAVPVKHVKIRGAGILGGKCIEYVKGADRAVARIAVQEGLWEEKRGHKVDGGERRKAEVRSKRRAAERKAQRV